MYDQRSWRPRNVTCFITLSMKRPTFLVFGLTSDPDTCNAIPILNRLVQCESPLMRAVNQKGDLGHERDYAFD